MISQSDNQRHFSFVGNLDIFDLTKWYCQYQWSDYDIVSINEGTMILSVSMKRLWYCQYQWGDYDIVSINDATMILSVSMKRLWYCKYQWSDYDIVSINEGTMILSVSMKRLWYWNCWSVWRQTHYDITFKNNVRFEGLDISIVLHFVWSDSTERRNRASKKL